MESSVLKQIEDLKEETGLTCCICREGYRYQPQKVSLKKPLFTNNSILSLHVLHLMKYMYMYWLTWLLHLNSTGSCSIHFLQETVPRWLWEQAEEVCRLLYCVSFQCHPCGLPHSRCQVRAYSNPMFCFCLHLLWFNNLFSDFDCSCVHFSDSVLYFTCITDSDCPCRHARGREEWESAALQNANTKCNGLLPLWGPHVQESAFATCLARYTLSNFNILCVMINIIMCTGNLIGVHV